MSERAPIARSHIPRACLLATTLSAVLAESLITLSAVFLDPPVSALVVCHLGVSLLLAGLAWRWGEDASIAVLLAIATTGAGPFGAVGMFAAMMADTRYRPKASIDEEAVGETAGEISKRLHDSIVAGRELSGRSSGLASFRDILALGSFQDKQAALAIITRRFTPPLAPALRLALRDPDAAVRVQAATAAARIEDLFRAGLTRHVARVTERPDDPDCRLTLALHLLGHTETGLCPPERAAADLEQALSHLRQAVALAPLRRDIRLAIAKVQLRRRDPQEAARHLESLMEPLSADEILTYGEALYQISGWPKLRQLFRSVMVRTDLPSQVNHMAALWAIPSETV
jgi:polysaccharide biosynthesis protein PelE